MASSVSEVMSRSCGPGSSVGLTASGKETSGCLNLPLAFFMAAFSYSLLRQQRAFNHVCK